MEKRNEIANGYSIIILFNWFVADQMCFTARKFMGATFSTESGRPVVSDEFVQTRKVV